MNTHSSIDENWNNLSFHGPYGAEMTTLAKDIFDIARHPSWNDRQKQTKITAKIIEEPFLSKQVISQIISSAHNSSEQDVNILCHGIMGYLRHLFLLPENSTEFATTHKILNSIDFYYRCGNFAQIAAYNLPRDDAELDVATTIMMVCADRLIHDPSMSEVALRLYAGTVNNFPTEHDQYPIAQVKFRIACGKMMQKLEGSPQQCWDFFTSLFTWCDSNDGNNGAVQQIADCAKTAASRWINQDPLRAYNGIFCTDQLIAMQAQLPRLSRRPMQVDPVHALTGQALQFALQQGSRTRG